MMTVPVDSMTSSHLDAQALLAASTSLMVSLPNHEGRPLLQRFSP